MASLLKLTNISKRFGAVTALDEVTVRFAPGQVHGVLGENGAGKSTLMNIAYGLLRADSGTIRVADEELRLSSPGDAIARGIGMVHQHFMLAPALTVLDNVLLGDRRSGWWLDRRADAVRLAQLGESVGLAVDPAARVEHLSVGQQQRVEILKALWRDVNMLILDEPTAVLTPDEAEQLFSAIDRLKAQGKAIIFISHKLNEVKRVCDQVTILRRGKVVWEGGMQGVSIEELAGRMVGEDRELKVESGGRRNRSSTPDTQPALLAVREMCAEGLNRIELDLRAGEILGVAGVDGNGQQELAETIVGLRRVRSGRILIGDQDVTRWHMKRRLALGLAHIPNDRKREALAVSMSISENAVLKQHDRPPLAWLGLVHWRGADRLAQSLMTRFDIRAPSTQTPVSALSGGNQQKVVLARELGIGSAKIIVAMNPARGLDIAATRFVFEQLRACRAPGAAVLLINSDLDELLIHCDRIAVLYAGQMSITEFPGTTREEIGRLMAGLRTV